jgi:hypothetical protein
MNNYEAIRADAQRRQVTRLCHFTPSRKLLHILTQTGALLPTQQIRERYPDLLDVTDNQRIDGRLDCICCSIQYPNVWYFRRVKDADILFKDWVIICLHPSLLWERDALFAPRNAAARGGTLLQPGWTGWRAMFQDQVQGMGNRVYTRQQLPDSCPTDDQAEVLIPDPIPTQYIHTIIVSSAQQLREEQTRLQVLRLEVAVEWRVAPALFTRGCSDLLRRGRIPEEEVSSTP